jgi:hypothetical protein
LPGTRMLDMVHLIESDDKVDDPRARAFYMEPAQDLFPSCTKRSA